MSVRLQVRVRTRARVNKVAASGKGEIRVYVTAAPEGGKANRAVIAAMAEAVGVPKSAVALVHGRASRDKLLEVAGVDTVAEAVRRIHG